MIDLLNPICDAAAAFANSAGQELNLDSIGLLAKTFPMNFQQTPENWKDSQGHNQVSTKSAPLSHHQANAGHIISSSLKQPACEIPQTYVLL